MTQQQCRILLDKVIRNLSTYRIRNYETNKYIKAQVALLSIILDEQLKNG